MKIKQTWNAINKVLTNINIFLLIILLVGGDPKKHRKIPLTANIILLLVLSFIVFYTLRSWSSSNQETSNFPKGKIAVSMNSACTTS